MNTNDIVKFKNETEEEKQAREDGIIMKVLWIDEPRAMIESIVPGFTVNPTQIVETKELEIA